MSAEEYYSVFRNLGYRPTGDGTLLIEEWINEFDEVIMITRANELLPQDRRDAAERIKRMLGVGFPIYPSVH